MAGWLIGRNWVHNVARWIDSMKRATLATRNSGGDALVMPPGATMCDAAKRALSRANWSLARLAARRQEAADARAIRAMLLSRGSPTVESVAGPFERWLIGEVGQSRLRPRRELSQGICLMDALLSGR